MDAIKKIFNSQFYFIISAIAVVEFLSFVGNFISVFEQLTFAIAVIGALILTFKRLKYGVWLILLELFIGSQGYLLYFDFGSFRLSLRIAFWLIVLSVWFKNYIFSFIDKKKNQPSIFSRAKIFSSGNFSFFLLLSFFILLGALIGYLNGNSYQNIFFDFNNWLFLLLIFPFYEVFLNPAKAEAEPFLPVWRFLAAGAAWIGFKTFFLFFIFTHAIPANDIIYQWVRGTLIGEITIMSGGFARIFIQSQIYAAIALLLGLFVINRYWLQIKQSRKAIILIIMGASVMLGTIIISLSRSFWIGLSAVFILYAILTIIHLGWKNFGYLALLLLSSLVISVALIFIVAEFPFPASNLNLNIAQTLTDRAGVVTNDAAASSRYALLPLLWQDISNAPLWGKGFGTTITYNARDPRLTTQSAGGSGIYTTYAFEWGWLDIWLKIGLFGLLAYLLLFVKIIRDAAKKDTWLSWGLSAGLLLIIVVSFFSPYTNHPLGIGYLLLAAAAIYKEHNGSCACA